MAEKILVDNGEIVGAMILFSHIEALNAAFPNDDASFRKVVNAVFSDAGADIERPSLSGVEEALCLLISKDVHNAIDKHLKKARAGSKGGSSKKKDASSDDDDDSDPALSKNNSALSKNQSASSNENSALQRKEKKRNEIKRNEKKQKEIKENAQAHLDQLGKLYPLGVNWSQVSANAKRELLNVSPAQMKSCVDNYERWREAQTTRDFSPRYKAATTWFERAWKDFVEYKPPANANTGGKRSQRYVSAEGPRDFSYAEAVSEVPPEIWKTLTDEQRKAWIDNYHGQAWTGEASPPYAVAN